MRYLVGIWVVFASIGWAQTGSSSLTGTVMDESGAVVPGVKLRIVREDSGAVTPTVSNDSGVYRVPALAPGTYRVEAAAEGFERLVRRSVVLAVSQSLAVDLVLRIGHANETVQVSEPAPLAESQSASVGQLVNRKMVAEMPMPNRAATSLVALAPGVVMIESGTGAENYPLFSVAGGRARNQDFTLDGGNVTNAVGLTRPQQMTSLPMDAMQEFRVITNNYAAEYGHSTGGVITLSTRSGTNDLHGSVFDFVRNSVLDARNFFAIARPPLRLQQFGASLGGPIRKDKTHFFGAWERTRQVSSTTVLARVPDAAMRQGNLSGLSTVIYDPATTTGRDRSPFAGNVIPLARLDPVARAAAEFWPAPNIMGANNHAGNNNSALDRDIVVARLDHKLSDKDQFTARYYLNDSFIDNRGSYGIRESDPDANVNDVRIQSILGAHTRVIRPSVVSEARVSFFQRKFVDQRFGAGENLAKKIGLTGVSAAAFPAFTVPGYAALGNAGGVSRTQTPIRDLEIIEAISWFPGKHAFKFGLEHRRGSNRERRDRSSAGLFGITPLITSRPGMAGTGDAFASFLLGEVNSGSILSSDVIASRAEYLGWYAQDDWRVTDRFTLNYGLRWESELPRYVENDAMNSFDPVAINPVSATPGVVTFAGREGVPRRAFNTDLNNFGPRLGLAWRVLGGGTVVRAGGGVFYGSTVSNTIGDAAALGFSTSTNLVVSQADLASALRLRDGFPAVARPALDAAFGAAPAGQRPSTAVTFFERDRPTPLSYQYNANIQHEVTKNVVMEAGYLANVSHHLTANDLSINQVAPHLMGAGDAQARRPFPQFSNVSIINPAVGNSTYHAGYIKAEKRLSKGVGFLAHYTFSKFIDDVASSVEYGDTNSYMDGYNRGLDKALSGSDVPHRLVISGICEVPHLRGRRWLDALAGDWSFGGFATLQSGAPFTVVTLANTTNAFPAGPLRPDVVAETKDPQRTLSRWFNAAAFRAPAPFTFGNSPRNGLRGGSLKTLDATVSKQFRMTERWSTEVRGEFYNLLNHANFDPPGRTLGAADFGVVSSARSGRTVQLGLRVSF